MMKELVEFFLTDFDWHTESRPTRWKGVKEQSGITYEARAEQSKLQESTFSTRTGRMVCQSVDPARVAAKQYAFSRCRADDSEREGDRKAGPSRKRRRANLT